jgi:CobQ-like glutamine amidotransferase family enzyme
VGNGDRTEGVELGGLIGTHLHGPVLAQNPALADALLTRAMQRRYQAPYAAGSAEARHVDELIAAIRRRATGSRGSA